MEKKIISNTLININQANKFLNTELKLVAWNTLVPTFPSVAPDHSFLYIPTPPISDKRIITSNILVEKKFTNLPIMSKIHWNVSLNHINDKNGDFGLHASGVKSGGMDSNDSEIPAYI